MVYSIKQTIFFSSYQRNHLTEFLRTRSSSSIGSCSSLTEIQGEEIALDEDDDESEQNDSGMNLRSRLMSAGENSLSPPPNDIFVNSDR